MAIVYGDTDSARSQSGSGDKPEWQTDEGSDTTYVAPDGPYGSNLKPGTIYTMTASGSFGTVKFTPSSSGGGGSSVSVSLGTQLGPNRYTTYTDAQGNLWQIDNADGSQSIIQRASGNPADKDGNGLDDTTNMAVGVYKWDGSPTGFGYGAGIPVWPDGSKYTGGLPGDKPNLSTVTMYGPQGQGMYVVDEDYNIVKYLGPTTAAGAGGSTGSSASSGSNTVRITGVSGSSGSSGGGSSSSYFDPVEYALESKSRLERLQAEEAVKAQYNTNTVSAEGSASRAFQAQQNEIDRQIRLQEAADRKNETAAERRLRAISEFRDAVTDTDPSAVHSWLYANGVGAGGNIVNRLGEGTDALSPNALAGAAALLNELRGGGQQAPMDWLNNVPGLQSALAPNTAPATGAGPGSPSPATPGPAATPMSTGVPGTAGYDPGAPTTPPPNGGQWGQFRADDGSFYYQEVGIPQVEMLPGTQIPGKLTGNVRGTGSSGRFYEVETPNGIQWWDGNKFYTYAESKAEIISRSLAANQTAGQKILNQIYTDKDGVQRVMGTGSGQSVLSADGMSWVPVEGSTPDQVWNYGTSLPQLQQLATTGINYGTGPIGTDALGQKSGVSYYQTAGGAPAIPYGNDNIQREVPLDPRLFNPDGSPKGIDPKVFGYPPDTTAQPGLQNSVSGIPQGPIIGDQTGTGVDTKSPTAFVSPKAFIPGLSRGGSAQMAVVGEGGGDKPLGSSELVVAPGGMDVIPLTSQKAQQLMAQGLPGYATGTDGSWVYGGTITGGSTGAAGWDAMRAAPQEEAVQYSAPQPTYYPPQQPVYQQPYVPPVAPKPVAPKPATTSAYTPTPATAPTPTGTAGAPPPTGAPTTSGVTSYADPRTAPASQPIAPNSNPMAPVVPPLPPSGVGFNESGGTYPVPVSTTPSPPGTPTAPGQPLQNATGSVYNTQNLTPEQLALLDEVTRVRATTPLPDIGGISPYSLMFKGLNPSSQTAWLQGMAARKGVPVGDFQWEIAKQRAMMPGLSRASAQTGY